MLRKINLAVDDVLNHMAAFPSFDLSFGSLSSPLRSQIKLEYNRPRSMTGGEAPCRSIVIEEAIVGVGGTANVVTPGLFGSQYVDEKRHV
jgi:hypothetical protein